MITKVVIMALTGMEKLGAALGLIPGVSTVVGTIKACVYYFRVKGSKADRQKMAAIAQRVNDPAARAMYNLHVSYLDKKEDYETRIFAYSILGTLPILNIFMATFEMAELNRLSKHRERMPPPIPPIGPRA